MNMQRIRNLFQTSCWACSLNFKYWNIATCMACITSIYKVWWTKPINLHSESNSVIFFNYRENSIILEEPRFHLYKNKLLVDIAVSSKKCKKSVTKMKTNKKSRTNSTVGYFGYCGYFTVNLVRFPAVLVTFTEEIFVVKNFISYAVW